MKRTETIKKVPSIAKIKIDSIAREKHTYDGHFLAGKVIFTIKNVHTPSNFAKLGDIFSN